ncbi:MAG: DUF3750 domain-containing protein [Alphaproteobacteria bacterium]|nr:DUF3750 domain-containing protein [Alphaproteobacteria bacterium]
MKKRLAAALLLCFVLPLGVSATVLNRDATSFWNARRDASGQAPDPATVREAVVQVYGARTVGWRGAFAVHTWIAVKPESAKEWTRYEVMGWGVDRGVPAVRVNRFGPDNYWFGARPELLFERRGAGVEEMIRDIRAAVAAYPYPDSYRTWPGPNSNTFVAHVARSVPGLSVDLPPHAIGKDWLPDGGLIAAAPSGTGLQVSLLGALGLTLALEEGVEFNLLGLTIGLDLNPPALKLPGLGRIGAGNGAGG